MYSMKDEGSNNQLRYGLTQQWTETAEGNILAFPAAAGVGTRVLGTTTATPSVIETFNIAGHAIPKNTVYVGGAVLLLIAAISLQGKKKR